MSEIVAKVHCRRGNHALVQLEGRKYPGLLLQGDSLKQIEVVVDELVELRREDQGDEFDIALHEIVEVVKGLTGSYESMMKEKKLELPY